MKIDFIIAYLQRYEFGHERDFVPPITGIHLAAITPAHHQVRVFHQQVDKIDFDTGADLVAISFFSGFAMAAYHLAVEFRKRGKILVAGGPHVTYCQEEALRYFDAIITGEAENKWPELLQDLENGNLKPVYVGTPCDMIDLPTPRYDLLPNRFFIRKVIQATRGCPFSCSFCTVPSLNPGFRLRPVKDVIRDASYDKFKYWWQRKIVWFWDDNLTIKRPYIRELLQQMIPLKKWWLTQASMDIAKDPELLDLMKASGCIGVFLGIESFGVDSLADANKRQNKIANYATAVKAIRKRGIAVMAGFIAGFDHDDEQSIVNMADQLMEIGIDVPFLSIMTPFRGTPIRTKLEQEGRILHDRNWNFYNGYNVAFKPNKITETQLLQAHRSLWKKSFSPWYAFRRIARGAFKLRWGAFLLSLFMNSFYCFKRVYRNYPIDMTNKINTLKIMKRSKLLAYTAAALLACANTYAQDKDSEVDKIFSWTKPAEPGCVCAISQNGKLVANRAYGSADLEREVPINVNTIFDAGSVSKQFIAAAGLLLVQDGKIALTDDVRKYIPELPDYGATITISQLMNHTSGLREWTGLLPFAGDKPQVYALILRQRNLNFKPGEQWSYSTSGFVLLKEVVARVSKMPFPEFMQKRVFDTLGMRSSSYRENMRDIIKNRALAYERDGSGRWRMAMLLDNDRGGGGVLSTASDLLTWNDAITNGRLGKFVSEEMQKPATLNNGRKLDYGRGLFLDSYRGTKEIWHSGSADGYKTWLGRYPEHGLSIAIMCNSGDGTDRIAFAHKIFDQFLPSVTQPDFDPAPAPVKDIDPATLAGLFFNEATGEPLRIAVQNGRLRVAEGPGFDQISNDRFKRRGANPNFMSQDEFEIHYLSNDQFEMKSMEGKITKYRRAKPFSPKADELKAFTGRYESDELRSVIHINEGKNGLEFKFEHRGDGNIPLNPVDPDVFQVSRVTIKFIRDKAGKVTGFTFSNPFARNMQFLRATDVAGLRR